MVVFKTHGSIVLFALAIHAVKCLLFLRNDFPGKSRRRKYSQWKLLKTLNIDFDISALFSMNVVKDEEVENENILQVERKSENIFMNFHHIFPSSAHFSRSFPGILEFQIKKNTKTSSRHS